MLSKVARSSWTKLVLSRGFDHLDWLDMNQAATAASVHCTKNTTTPGPTHLVIGVRDDLTNHM